MLQNRTENLLFSIVMPVYNTPIEFLNKAINSVKSQSYLNWELCIADDNSSNPQVEKCLLEHAESDSRIKLVFRKQNGHISAASNTSLEIARGDFIALLDHDDELTPDALEIVAASIKSNPAAKIIYSDEDKISESGILFNPHFKSDWNPVLFESINYICHLVVIEAGLIRKVGGFRTGYEGAQDYDLLLRCVSEVRSNTEILHIPKILYHWRALDGSTALSVNQKSYAHGAGEAALADYVKRNQIDGVVTAGPVETSYRIKRNLSYEPKVSIIIPTKDMVDLLRLCIQSIEEKTSYSNYEIVVVDNGSTKAETHNYFSEISLKHNVRVIEYSHPFNFSALNNFAVSKCDAEIIALVNNDIEVISSEWLYEMVSFACMEDVGCVGAKLYYGNETIQHGGVIIGVGGVAGHSHKHYEEHDHGYMFRLVLPQNLSGVTAACMVVRKSVYIEVGGFEEDLQVAFNDVDFCLKVRDAGYKNVWTPFAKLYHHESLSRGYEDTPEKKSRFSSEVIFMKNKWGDKLKSDPFYSPHLNSEVEDFSISSESVYFQVYADTSNNVLVTDENFDESSYLFSNPDVLNAVSSGIFQSGLEHFEKFGRTEKRTMNLKCADIAYQENSNASVNTKLNQEFERTINFNNEIKAI